MGENGGDMNECKKWKTIRPNGIRKLPYILGGHVHVHARHPFHNRHQSGSPQAHTPRARDFKSSDQGASCGSAVLLTLTTGATVGSLWSWGIVGEDWSWLVGGVGGGGGIGNWGETERGSLPGGYNRLLCESLPGWRRCRSEC